MMITWLAATLRATGLLTVVEEPGWETRTRTRWGRPRVYTPVGVMNHHTAPPVPYPVKKLYRSCNLNIKRDGTVYVIAAGYQYDSGIGMASVLARTKAGLAPLGDATHRGATNGNPWYIDIEVDHPGDGSPIPAAQYAALITVDAAICDHMGWTANRVIGHREWTSRKPDPRWAGNTNPMPAIRTRTAQRLDNPTDNPQEDNVTLLKRGDRSVTVADLQRALIDIGYDLGRWKPYGSPRYQYPPGADGIYGTDTITAVAAFQTSRNLPATGDADLATITLIGLAV